MQVKNHIKKSFQQYSVHAKEIVSEKTPQVEEFLAMQEYEDVFQEVPRLPLKRGIDFTIELVPLE
jgi:hypothetical protein